jgi:hypothetical protein
MCYEPCREYLELWNGNQKYHELLRRINSVKVYGKYITPVHQFVYNNLYSRYNCLTDVFENIYETNRAKRARDELSSQTFLMDIPSALTSRLNDAT